MAGTGFFLDPRSSTLFAPRVIYRQPAPAPPTSTARPPVNRMPTPQPTPTGFSPPTQVFPVNVDPGGNEPQPVSPLGGGGGFVPSGPTQTGPTAGDTGGGETSTPGTTGAGTGGNVGGSGSTGSDRVLDLIAGLLKPQDISQPLSPTIVPDTSTGPQGTNPMAIVILAIAVIAGIFWFAHRKKRAA